MPDRIETPTAVITLKPPGIIWIEYRPDATDGPAEADANLTAQEQLTSGQGAPTLIDIRPMAGIEKEARDLYASSRANAVNWATALVVKSRISKVIGTFFIGLNKPGRPTRLFTTTEAAEEWLRGFHD